MNHQQREHRKILELVRGLRRDGFDVTVEGVVGPQKLRADIVARRANQTLVIEVRTSDSLRTDKAAVVQLADYVRTLPDHRFDLVLTNPRRRREQMAVSA